MPYLYIQTMTADAIKREVGQAPPLGPGFPADLAARADRLEVWVSAIGDPGDDTLAACVNNPA